MIRAYYPWPGVWTKWRGKIVKFLPSSSHPRPRIKYGAGSDRGSIHIDSRFRSPRETSPLAGEAGGNDEFVLQMEGKKAISFKDFLNGYPDFPLKIFDK